MHGQCNALAYSGLESLQGYIMLSVPLVQCTPALDQETLQIAHIILNTTRSIVNYVDLSCDLKGF